MRLESMVISRELAEELKALGVRQDSLFYWRKNRASHLEGWNLADCIDTHSVENYSAFTSGELGEMLPEKIEDDEDGTIHRLYIFRSGKSWITVYRYEENKTGFWSTTYAENSETMTNSIAKMLIYLIKQNLITVEDINKSGGRGK